MKSSYTKCDIVVIARDLIDIITKNIVKIDSENM